jgi:DNA-binding transcriptional ArsR family regulator
MSRTSDPTLTDVFFALGDATRMAVLARLCAAGGLSATALSDGAAVSRQAIVKHLHVLEDAGLVTHQRQGREVLYVFDGRQIGEAVAFLEAMSAGWDRAIERLRDLVEAPRSGARRRGPPPGTGGAARAARGRRRRR